MCLQKKILLVMLMISNYNYQTWCSRGCSPHIMRHMSRVVSLLDMVASYGQALAQCTKLGKCTFLKLGKQARMDACTIVKMCQAFLASLKNNCFSPKYSCICQNTTIFLPDTVVFIRCLIAFAYKYPQITLYLP